VNIVLWILQITLAFTYFAGGSYKLSKSDVLTSQVPAMPRGGWRILGVIVHRRRAGLGIRVDEPSEP